MLTLYKKHPKGTLYILINKEEDKKYILNSRDKGNL